MTQEHIHPFIQLIIDNWDKSGAWSEIVEAMRLVLPVGIGAAESREDPSRWALLPGLCCQAAGGDPQAAKEISSAWLLLHIAAHIVDDVEDGDLEGDVSALGGPGSAINVANGLFLSASLLLLSLHDKKDLQSLASQISADFYNTILIMTSAQHHDLIHEHLTLKEWWQVAEAKSGSFFSLACRCGARLGIDDPEKIQGYSDFGFHLGVMLQILDDIEDLQPLFSLQGENFPANVQKSLAMAYAFDVLPEVDKVELKEWINTTPREPQMVENVVEILNRCGAGLYMMAEAEKHFNLGMKSLQVASPSSPAGEKLASLLHQLRLD